MGNVVSSCLASGSKATTLLLCKIRAHFGECLMILCTFAETVHCIICDEIDSVTPITSGTNGNAVKKEKQQGLPGTSDDLV